jgi:hypothetical protein
MRVAEAHGRDDVFGRLRQHDAIGDLPIVRSVGRIERAIADREADFAFEHILKRRLQLLDLRLRDLHALPHHAAAGRARTLDSMSAFQQIGHLRPRIFGRRRREASGRVQVARGWERRNRP